MKLSIVMGVPRNGCCLFRGNPIFKLDDDFGGTPISGILQEELLGWGKIGGLRVYKVGPTNDSDS